MLNSYSKSLILIRFQMFIEDVFKTIINGGNFLYIRQNDDTSEFLLCIYTVPKATTKNAKPRYVLKHIIKNLNILKNGQIANKKEGKRKGNQKKKQKNWKQNIKWKI